MGRPQNTQLKAQILEAAACLFASQGYDATSYSAVAAECGVSRNLVQYHFGKKEMLAVAFMESRLTAAQESLGLSAADLMDNFEAIGRVGACYFEQLLAEPGLRQFLLDILRNRDLTETVLAFNLDWIGQFLSDGAPADHEAALVVVLKSMGGFYELLYYALSNNKPINIQAELRGVLTAFATTLPK